MVTSPGSKCYIFFILTNMFVDAMLTLASTVGRWLYAFKHTQRKTMSYTIEEVSNKLINTEDKEHLSFFYKFKLIQKEEFANIELNPYVDEDKARLMAANIIAEKIAKKLTYKVQKDEKYRMTTILSFSERHVELEEREVYEQLKNQLVKTLSEQQLVIDEQHKSMAQQRDIIKKQSQRMLALLSCSGLFFASALIQFFN